MSNQKLVSIDDAKIATLAVEIKTVTIGRKQMTHSVFKQLPSDVPLVDDTDETLRLNGLPWGRVNYHWNACDASPHLHVLWQKDSTLRQSVVRLTERLGITKPFCKDQIRNLERRQNLVCAGVLLMAAHNKTEVSLVAKGHITTADLKGWSTANMAAVQLFKNAQIFGKYEDRGPHYKKMIEMGNGLLTKESVVLTTTTEEILKLVNAAYAREKECKAEIERFNTLYKQRITELQALEQLFIAA